MTALLIRWFVKDPINLQDPEVRRRYGYLAGGTGIAANLVLFAVKLTLGLLSRSIAVMADAFNNLTDCASSVMTLVGFWTAGKPADKEHPFGHGRSEYITALVVSMLVMVVGFQFARSAVERILNPVSLGYDTVTVVILASTIAVKGWLALFYRSIGRSIGSKVMEATATDSLGDVATTGIVVVSLVAGPLLPPAFDGFVGLAVALLIVWNGWNLVMDTLSPLLGEAPDEAFVEALESRFNSYEGVLGHHDLVVHNYGHGRAVVSIHVEVPVALGMIAAHGLIDTMEREIGEALGIDLLVHMDPVDCDNAETTAARAVVEAAMGALDERLSLHDFRIVHGKGGRTLYFDLVIPQDLVQEEQAIVRQLSAAAEQACGCRTCIQIDRQYAMLHADGRTTL